MSLFSSVYTPPSKIVSRGRPMWDLARIHKHLSERRSVKRGTGYKPSPVPVPMISRPVFEGAKPFLEKIRKGNEKRKVRPM